MVNKKLGAAAVWAGLVGGYFWYAQANDLSPIDAAERLLDIVANNWWGPALFIVFYTFRPLVLFPASVLTIMAGLVWGPVWGSVWTIIASNLSTAATYVVGRYFGSEAIVNRMRGVLGKTVDRAQSNPFEATFMMRLLYLPFDAVGYIGGFLRLPYVPFALGSALGTILGTIAFVGIGASVGSISEASATFDWRILAGSLLLAAVGSLVSRRLKNRESANLHPLET